MAKKVTTKKEAVDLEPTLEEKKEVVEAAIKVIEETLHPLKEIRQSALITKALIQQDFYNGLPDNSTTKRKLIGAIYNIDKAIEDINTAMSSEGIG